MVIALLIWFIRPAGQKFILSFLLVFSVAAQVWMVNIYRHDWRTQLDYYWQLYWRAPALKSGTAIMSLEQPSPFVTHYSDAGFAINVLYHYQTEDGSLPYWYFSRRHHFDYKPDMPIRYELRTLNFMGNTSDAVAVLHPADSACVRVLDPVYNYDRLFNEGQGELMPVSNPARIIPDYTTPPDPDIFGPEPEHTWCYFFEKADLARQTKDWDTAIALYKQAQQKDLTPDYGAEYIPFIEAYAQTGDWQKAYDLTAQAQNKTRELNEMLCMNWSRLGKIPSADLKVIAQAEQFLSCSK
jgi:tetratricopeptide (TPR) repeat protein